MLRRIESDDANPAAGAALAALERGAPIVAAVPDAELESPQLPHDHPRWVKDALTVSSRARELLARMRPIAVTILTFWDHRVRAILVGDTRISVDPSGCYRIDR